MTRQFTSMAAMSAMLLTSATQPTERIIAPPPPDNSPVKCRIAEPPRPYYPPVYAPRPQPRPLSKQELREQRRQDSRDARMAPYPAPPAPPPPPPSPPPPPMPMSYASPLVAQRMAVGGARPAGIRMGMAQPADTARYAGKEVAQHPLGRRGAGFHLFGRCRHRQLRQRPPLPQSGAIAAVGRGADRGNDQLFPLRLRAPDQPRAAVQRHHRCRADAVEPAVAAAADRAARL